MEIFSTFKCSVVSVFCIKKKELEFSRSCDFQPRTLSFPKSVLLYSSIFHRKITFELNLSKVKLDLATPHAKRKCFSFAEPSVAADWDWLVKSHRKCLFYVDLNVITRSVVTTPQTATDQRLYRYLKIDEVESSKLKADVAWALKSKHSKDYKANRTGKVLEYVFWQRCQVLFLVCLLSGTRRLWKTACRPRGSNRTRELREIEFLTIN